MIYLEGLIIMLLLFLLVFERVIIYRALKKFKEAYKMQFSNKPFTLVFNIALLLRSFYKILKSKDVSLQITDSELNQRQSDIMMVYNATKQLLSAKNADVLNERIVRVFLNFTSANVGSIAVYNEEQDKYIVEYGENINIERISGLKFKPGEGLVGECARRKEIWFIEDISSEPKYKSFSLESPAEDTEALLVPLVNNDTVIGVISLESVSGFSTPIKHEKFILKSFANLAAMAIINFKLFNKLVKQEILERQIKLTKEIQKNIMQIDEFSLTGYETGYNMIPALQISGDFYVIRETANKKGTIFALGDVVGKGFSSALMMATAKISLEILADDIEKPEDIKGVLARLNDIMFSKIKDDEKFFTIIFAYLDNETGKLYYINSGHTYPIKYNMKNDEFELLKEKGMALGFLKDVTSFLNLSEVSLQEGDFMLFYSDGLLDVKNKEEVFLDERGLLDILFYIKKSKGAGEKTKELEREIKRYMKTEPTDDITYIFLERTNGTN